MASLEAIEAILFGESRLSLKAALLFPPSSAVSIGNGDGHAKRATRA